MSFPGGRRARRSSFQSHPSLHPKCPSQAPLVPITPALVRVLQTLQMSTHRRHCRTSNHTRCSCAYFRHSKCPNAFPIQAADAHSTRPKDTRARARTSNSPSVHSRRQRCTCSRSKDTRSRARTSNSPDFHSGGNAHVHSSHGATCSRELQTS
jgi:hypothetical protein